MANRFTKQANLLRERLGVSLDRVLDIPDLLVRLRLDGLIAGHRLVSASELPDVDARWDSTTRMISIRKSVFDGAAAGSPSDRFTLAHEVGHAILGHPPRNRRVDAKVQFGRYVEAHELEADDFAIALLAPTHMIDLSSSNSPDQLAHDFGLPLEVATRWFSVLVNEPGRKMPRAKPMPGRKRAVLIDTGNYEDAAWAMSLNVERKSDE